MNCKNCNNEVNLDYCPNCGLAVNLKRINGHHIIHEIEHVLHFERGILFTIRELITNPGENIRNYLLENRTRLVKPIIFIIVTSLIYSLCSHFFHFEDHYMQNADDTGSTTNVIFKWMQEHYGYANIIMGVFIALWIKLFFRKYPFNIFEILILLCFVMGMGMVVLSIFGIFEGVTHLKTMQFGAMFLIFYITWAIGQFYEKGKIINYVKAFFAYILGLLTFVFTAVLIGSLIDLMIKH